jgi:hypothetical protein
MLFSTYLLLLMVYFIQAQFYKEGLFQGRLTAAMCKKPWTTTRQLFILNAYPRFTFVA